MRGFPGMGGMGGMMAQVQKMQQNLERAKEEVDQMTFEGEAAGGLVKVVVSGKHEVQSIKIDPKAVDPEDMEMLEDVLVVALNQAITKAEETKTAMIQKAAPMLAGMKLPF